MIPYSFAVEETVLGVFAAARPREQRRLLDFFNQLGSKPFRDPDWIEYDATNRPVAVAFLGEWLISYWVDHATRKIMIVDLAPVDGS